MIDAAIDFLTKIPPTDMTFYLLLTCLILATTSSLYRRKKPNRADLFNIASIPLTAHSFITIVILSGDFAKMSAELVIPIYWALAVHIYICVVQIMAIYSRENNAE